MKREAAGRPCLPCLTVGLLVPSTGTGTTKLLGLAATVVGDKEGTVERDEGLLERVLGVLIDELLVVGDKGLGDSLTDGVDLRGVATSGHSYANVHIRELIETEDEEWLVDLVSENGRLDKLERPSIDLDDGRRSLASAAVSNCGRRLLLSEALNALCRRHDGWYLLKRVWR